MIAININKEQIYTYIIYTSYFLYIVVALGLSRSAPTYLKYLDSFIRIYVSLFLIYHFNPFIHNNAEFTNFDRKIAFSAGVFIFTTTAVNQLLVYYLYLFTKTIKKHISNK
jgi:hypothetical protein